MSVDGFKYKKTNCTCARNLLLTITLLTAIYLYIDVSHFGELIMKSRAFKHREIAKSRKSNMTFIRHITLTSGHVRDSLSNEVSQVALEYYKQLIREITNPNEPDKYVAVFPEIPEYTINGALENGNLIATVWRNEVPIVTIGVAMGLSEGSDLWKIMHQDQIWPLTLATREDQCPTDPWCAAKIQPGLMLYPDAARWLGDFERCLAWAFLLTLNS